MSRKTKTWTYHGPGTRIPDWALYAERRSTPHGSRVPMSYEIYGANGELLYVGSAARAGVGQRVHGQWAVNRWGIRDDLPWTIKATEHESELAARVAEQETLARIHRERIFPLRNRTFPSESLKRADWEPARFRAAKGFAKKTNAQIAAYLREKMGASAPSESSVARLGREGNPGPPIDVAGLITQFLGKPPKAFLKDRPNGMVKRRLQSNHVSKQDGHERPT